MAKILAATDFLTALLLKEKNEKKQTVKAAAGKSNFANLVERSRDFAEMGLDPQNSAADIENNRQLEAALDDVFVLGDKLKNDPALSMLSDYKKAVRRFLNVILAKAYRHAAVRGAKNPRTMMQKEYSVVKTVDENLDKLARAVLSEQRDTLAILARIDEIRGLLIDYMR